MSTSQAVELPSMPGTVVQLLQLFDDPEVGMMDVADLLKTDAALTMRILKAANNSTIGTASEVTDIHRATSLLGRKTVSALALSFSLMDHSLNDGEQSDLFHSFWTQSLLTGVATSVLNKHYEGMPPGEAFLIGLLSCIGRLGAISFAADAYRGCIARSRMESIDVDRIRLPKSEITCDELTLQYLDAWELPGIFYHSIAQMQEVEPCSTEQQHRQATLLKIARTIGQFSIGENQSEALARMHELLDTIDADYESQIHDLLNAVMAEAEQYGQLLDFDVSQIESPAELRCKAMAQLAEIMLSPDDPLPEAANTAEVDWLKERVNQLSHRLTIDPMTRVHNRAHFEDQLERRIAKARLSRQWVSVLFVDINDFKLVNDQHGHDVGDAVIVSVATLLSSHVRKDDLVARYGGDEFVVLCECNQQDGLNAQAARLSQKMASITACCREHEVNVEVALGGATGIPEGDHFAARIVRAADEAMYEAKVTRSNPKTRLIGAGTPEAAEAGTGKSELSRTERVHDQINAERKLLGQITV